MQGQSGGGAARSSTSSLNSNVTAAMSAPPDDYSHLTPPPVPPLPTESMDIDNTNPQIVPTTLEQDLFGDQADSGTALPTAVQAREQGDLDDLPPPSTMGVQSIVQEEDDDEGDGLFGDDEDDEDAKVGETEMGAVPKEPTVFDTTMVDAKQEVAQADETERKDFSQYLGAGEDHITDEELARRKALEYDEDDRYGAENEAALRHEESIAQLSIAPYPIPATEKVWHAKLPNFLSLDSKAFDDKTWEPPIKDEDGAVKQEDEDIATSSRTAVEDGHFIRWRWAKDKFGGAVKETNSRIVRWSDGSLSLQLGTELFDINAAIDHSALLHSSVPQTAMAGSTSTTAELSSFDANRGHGLTYLVAEHGYSSLFEAQASVHGTFTFRPSNLKSETHRRLAGNIARRYEKKTRSKMAMTHEDPERKKAEMEKAALDKQRKAARANKAKGTTKHKRQQTRFEDWDGEGEDTQGDSAMDEDDGWATSRRSQPKRGPGGVVSTSYEQDDEGFVVDDDEDAEGEIVGDDDGDDLDALETRAEAAERREQRRKDANGGSKSSPPPSQEPAVAPRRRMVIESDEDE